jgi:hypothetical protein
MSKKFTYIGLAGTLYIYLLTNIIFHLGDYPSYLYQYLSFLNPAFWGGFFLLDRLLRGQWSILSTLFVLIVMGSTTLLLAIMNYVFFSGFLVFVIMSMIFWGNIFLIDRLSRGRNISKPFAFNGFGGMVLLLFISLYIISWEVSTFITLISWTVFYMGVLFWIGLILLMNRLLTQNRRSHQRHTQQTEAHTAETGLTGTDKPTTGDSPPC